MTATWAQVHVGDEVRGADQRVWAVAYREQLATWIGSGVTEIRFVFRHAERGEVRAVRRAHDPAPRRGGGAPPPRPPGAGGAPPDHTDSAAAFELLAAAGLAPKLLLEEIALTDPFAAPAPARLGGTAKHDRWDRYLLPDPITGDERAWTRVTTVAKTISDEYHLTLWKLRMVAKGMALRPDLVAGAAAADPEEDKKALNDLAEQAMKFAKSGAGANYGTALHKFCERIDQGDATAAHDVPEALAGHLDAYTRALRAHRLTVHREYMERIVVLPDLGIAGRFDRIVGQPAGVTHSEPLAIFDLKTEKDPSFDWLKIAIQEALYAHATHMWNAATQSYEPMPKVDQSRGLVLHLPVRKVDGQARAQLHGVNLIDGWRHVQTAMEVRSARSTAKALAWLVDPEPADLALHRVAKAADQAELAQLWDQLHPQGLWTEEVNAAAAKRWEEINAPVTV